MRFRLGYIALSLIAASIVGCGDTTPPVQNVDEDIFSTYEANLKAPANDCTLSADGATMVVTAAAADAVIFIAKRSGDGAILVNGQGCKAYSSATPPVLTTNVVLPSSGKVKKLTINSAASNAAELVILDFTAGLFALGVKGTPPTGQIIVNLQGGADTLGIRGTSGADNITFGSDVSNMDYVDLNTDGVADIQFLTNNVAKLSASLGAGADKANTGTLKRPVDIYGGAGADTIDAGTVNNVNNVYSGGTGLAGELDTITYASRTANVTVSLGDTDADGESTETDDVRGDFEVITGGSGNDTLIGTVGGSAIGHTLNGGAGNDLLFGGDGNDVYNGGAGNDIMYESDETDRTSPGVTTGLGADIINGGDGEDTVTYELRAGDVTITMDGIAANDGEANENDKVAADVERVYGGLGNDTITGNLLDNTLIVTDGDGDDTFNGGAGVDTIDYSNLAFEDDGTTAMDATADGVIVVMDGTTPSGLGNGTAATEADIIGTDVENCVGTIGVDDITGNAANNEITGWGGEDTIAGLDGDDIINVYAADGTTKTASVIDCGDGGQDIVAGETGGTVDASCEIER